MLDSLIGVVVELSRAILERGLGDVIGSFGVTVGFVESDGISGDWIGRMRGIRDGIYDDSREVLYHPSLL